MGKFEILPLKVSIDQQIKKKWNDENVFALLFLHQTFIFNQYIADLWNRYMYTGLRDLSRQYLQFQYIPLQAKLITISYMLHYN